MLNIALKEIFPNFIHVIFETQFETNSTMLRFSEYVESPFKNIKGKFFTYEQFMQSYADNQVRKEFTYFTDWAGFNVKGETFVTVAKLFKDDLWEREKQLLGMLSPWISSNKKFYVIGTSVDGSTNQSLINHETAHALSYMNTRYFKAQNKNLTNLKKNHKDIYDGISKSLYEIGYGKKVIRDEIQAYMSASSYSTIREIFPDQYRDIKNNNLMNPFIDTLKEYI